MGKITFNDGSRIYKAKVNVNRASFLIVKIKQSSILNKMYYQGKKVIFNYEFSKKT